MDVMINHQIDLSLTTFYYHHLILMDLRKTKMNNLTPERLQTTLFHLHRQYHQSILEVQDHHFRRHLRMTLPLCKPRMEN